MTIKWIEKEVQIKDLKEYDRNPRRIKDDAFKHLVRSLKEDGYHQRLIVNQDMTIIGGHQRKAALLSSGFKMNDKISILIPDKMLEENDFKRLNIRDNLPYGEFDFDMLSSDFDTEDLLDWGFPEDWLPEQIDEVNEGLTDDDAVPELPKEAKTKEGDIYILGNHRLMCGDSTSIDSVEKLMAGVKADMVFTDPPYNTGMSAKNNGGSTWLNHMFDDDFSDEEWQSFLSDFTNAIYLVLKEDSTAYICLDWRRNHELVPFLDQSFKRSNLIVWDKVVHGLGSDYKYTHEFINVCKKGKPNLNTHQGEDAEYSDVWHIQRKMGKDDEHATKKPVEIVERCIRHATKKNDLVLDIFGGSGSTLIACEKTNRKCFMMELSPHYCDVIIERWEKFTGKKAELVVNTLP